MYRDCGVNHDPYAILSGTPNQVRQIYLETKDIVENGTDPKKQEMFTRNFVASIERMAGKKGFLDEKIRTSGGNIEKVMSFENVKTAITILENNKGLVTDKTEVTDLKNIISALEKNKPLYTRGFEKRNRLIILEYHAAVEMMNFSASYLLANNIDIEFSNNGAAKIARPKARNKKGLFFKTQHDLAKALNDKNHAKYLESLLSNEKTAYKESFDYMQELSLPGLDGITDSMGLIDGLVNSLTAAKGAVVGAVQTVIRTAFGIIPLIRTIFYFIYKSKAKKILDLDEQIIFIENNIDQLKNRKNIEPGEKAEIIKKQQAHLEMYRKKAAKLRAEIESAENDTKVAIQQDDTKIRNNDNTKSKDDDDDFVLDAK